MRDAQGGNPEMQNLEDDFGIVDSRYAAATSECNSSWPKCGSHVCCTLDRRDIVEGLNTRAVQL